MQRCRLCGHQTKAFLDLGRVPLPEEFRLKKDREKRIITYPLGLSYCIRCFHVQLTRPVGADPIYKNNYFYDYSVTAAGRAHWQQLARLLGSTLTKKDLVVDVGSNTGTLLSYFKASGFRILGVDPAGKLVRIARANGIPTINAYFTPAIAQKIVKQYGRARVITCTNVFDHVAELDRITKAFRLLLAPGGTLVIEVPYFYRMLTKCTHIVYHQQIDYMMLTQLVSYFRSFGLTVVDAQEIPLHGGSMRLYVKHKGNATKRLGQLLVHEKKIISQYPKRLVQFGERVLHQRDAFATAIKKLKKQHKTIAAVGASAKGITLLNYSGLGPTDIAFITEKSPLKIGRFTPNGIPVVKDGILLTRQPDYAILLSWNFAGEIMGHLTSYTGHWIIPVPSLRVLS